MEFICFDCLYCTPTGLITAYRLKGAWYPVVTEKTTESYRDCLAKFKWFSITKIVEKPQLR